jgi:hypothetical protein
MTIDRRQAFRLSALGLGAIALEGCGTGPMPSRGAAMGPADIDRVLGELDKVVAHLESFHADPEKFWIHGEGAEVTRGRQRCSRLLTTLCLMGTYKDLPESAWRPCCRMRTITSPGSATRGSPPSTSVSSAIRTCR